MTISYRLTLETTAPVHCAATRAAGGEAAALPYLPGSALRGALAALLLQRVPAEDAAFSRFSTDVRVGNMLPVAGDAASAPTPLSAVSCSRAPGFKADGGDGVADLLLLAEALALRQEAGSDGGTDAASLLACAHGGGERRRATGVVAPWRGFVAWSDETPRGAAPHFAGVVSQRLSPARRARAGDAAYRQALAPGRSFAGVVAFTDDATADLVTRELAPSGATLWVGSDRSRGLGATAVRGWERIEPLDNGDARRTRLEERLRALCEQVGAPTPEGGRYAALTLRSPAILRDAFGRYRQGLDGATLAALCGLPAEAVALRQAFVGTTTVEGWNAALGLPKPDALALAAGSCWLVRIDGDADAGLDEALTRLERDGMGERREEGFGAVTSADPFHWQVQELELELDRTQ